MCLKALRGPPSQYAETCAFFLARLLKPRRLLYKNDDNRSDFFASFQKGEERGYAHYFHKFHSALCHYAENFLRDKDQAEDMASDSLIKLYQKRETIQSEVTIASFLYTTTRNACYDRLRRGKVEATHAAHVRYHGEEILPNAQDLLIRTETLRLLAQAVEELPPAMRTVFTQFYYEGKSYHEIANDLGKSAHTIKKQKYRALELLRKRLGLGVWMMVIKMLLP